MKTWIPVILIIALFACKKNTTTNDTSTGRLLRRGWKFEVGCWKFDVIRIFKLYCMAAIKKLEDLKFGTAILKLRGCHIR